MEKTPIAVALERQIPEFIREEYDLFVKFIKAYYEFLEQTQMRNLEDIGSIQNTLDEFIDRFKKQLSFLFPTNSLVNERFILQRIGEFYKTRGSKESFEFLFRALFNTQADIFYPSTQILRPSDGKWVQEKSVFVEVISGDPTKFGGKIISIDTDKKHLRVFCPRVSFYRTGIYEVFIEHNIVSDIAIDDVVSITEDGVTHSGKILPCPTKYTIITEGLGFDVGSIHNLRSETGEGSVVKITRIGPNGEVKKIQVISFGLDYKSTFYAKLISNYRLQRPITTPVFKIWDYNNTPVGYTEAITSSTTITAVGSTFTEYLQAGDRIILGRNETTGQGTNANYLYGQFTVVDVVSDTELTIDTAVSVPSNTPIYKNPAVLDDGSDGYVDYGYINKQDYFYYDANYSPSVNTNDAVFYVDATYVGEIVATFYTNAANSAIIDNSIAEVKIELGAVAVYPGYYRTNDGFVSDEMYIQDGRYYQIFSYVIKVEKQLDTFKDIVMNLLHPAGFEMFSEYTIKNNFVLEASPLIAFVRRQFFDQEFISDSEYLEVHKSLVSVVESVYDEITEKNVTKPLADETTQSVLVSKDVSKVVLSNDSAVEVVLTSRVNSFTKETSDTQLSFDIIQKKDMENVLSDTQIILENDAKFVSKPFIDIDSIETPDNEYFLLTAPKEDTQPLADFNSYAAQKSVTDISIPGNETLFFSISGGTFDKSVSLGDSYVNNFFQVSTDSVSNSDSQISLFTKNIAISQTTIDLVDTKFTEKQSSDNQIVVDDENYALARTVTDQSTAAEQLSNSLTTTKTENQSVVDATATATNKSYFESLTQSETLLFGLSGESFDKSVITSDNQLVSLSPGFVETISAPTDSFSRVFQSQRTFSDTQITLDSPDKSFVLGELSETVPVTEAIIIGNIYFRTYEDTFIVIEGDKSWDISGGSFNKSVSISETIVSEVSFLRSVSEQLISQDSFIDEITKPFTETLSISESVPVRSITQQVSEQIDILAEGLTWNISGSTFVDQFNKQDNFTSEVSYIRDTNEVITLGETFVRPIDKNIDEQPNVSDSYVAQLTRPFSETASASHGDLEWAFSGGTFIDTNAVQDQRLNSVTIEKTDSSSTTDADVYTLSKDHAESSPVDDLISSKNSTSQTSELLSSLDSPLLENSFIRDQAEQISSSESVLFGLSGETFNQLVSTPSDQITARTIQSSLNEVINSLSSGLLYFNPYNISSGIVNSYFAESYTSNETTTSIS